MPRHNLARPITVRRKLATIGKAAGYVIYDDEDELDVGIALRYFDARKRSGHLRRQTLLQRKIVAHRAQNWRR